MAQAFLKVGVSALTWKVLKAPSVLKGVGLVGGFACGVLAWPSWLQPPGPLPGEEVLASGPPCRAALGVSSRRFLSFGGEGGV